MNLVHSQIPSDIDTVEKLLVWCAYTLDSTYNTVKVKEEENADMVYVVQNFVMKIADGSTRFTTRISLPFNPAWASVQNVKGWQHTREISDIEIPTDFTSN